MMLNCRAFALLIIFLCISVVSAHSSEIKVSWDNSCPSGCAGQKYWAQEKAVKTTKYIEGYRPLWCLKICHKHRTVDTTTETYYYGCCTLALKSSDSHVVIVLRKQSCQTGMS
jgi:hypothetical protein